MVLRLPARDCIISIQNTSPQIVQVIGAQHQPGSVTSRLLPADPSRMPSPIYSVAYLYAASSPSHYTGKIYHEALSSKADCAVAHTVFDMVENVATRMEMLSLVPRSPGVDPDPGLDLESLTNLSNLACSW